MHDCDVVVVGAGPAGAVLAGSLAAKHRVLLVERSAKDGSPRRGEACPPGARPLLRDAGLQEAIAGSHATCYGNISVWGTTVPTETDFIFDPNGAGLHLDRAVFDGHLRSLAIARGAKLLRPCSVERVTREPDGTWIVALRTAERTMAIRARVMADATGRAAQLARRALGATRVVDDRLACAYLRWQPSCRCPAPWPGRTLVEAAPDGWWYAMTLPAGDRLLAFHTDVDLPAFRAARTWSGFQELARATMLVRSALDGLDAKAPHAIAVTAAHSAQLERAIGPGWVAIGDASAAFDPLSSQGLTHALFTAVTAGEALQSLLEGEAHPLVRYAEANADIYSRYRVALRETYRMETRWRERPFWARRS